MVQPDNPIQTLCIISETPSWTHCSCLDAWSYKGDRLSWVYAEVCIKSALNSGTHHTASCSRTSCRRAARLPDLSTHRKHLSLFYFNFVIGIHVYPNLALVPQHLFRNTHSYMQFMLILIIVSITCKNLNSDQVGPCPVCINTTLVVCWDAKGGVRGPLLVW